MKRCSKCGIEKSLSEFYCDKANKKDGYRPDCKDCVCGYQRKNKNKNIEYHKEYRKLHKDEIDEYQKEYRRKNKEKTTKRGKKYREDHKEELIGYYKKYRESHKEEIREYRNKNKDKISEIDKKYNRKNKDRRSRRYKEYCKTSNGKLVIARRDHKRRAIYKNECSDITLARGAKILQSQSNKCNICHKKFTAKRPATQDHIVPISRGGGLKSDNIQALCRSCNSTKHAKLDKGYIQIWNILC